VLAGGELGVGVCAGAEGVGVALMTSAAAGAETVGWGP
jgi:hypothetical protein